MDLDKLEALAKNATPGPWDADANVLIGGMAVYTAGANRLDPSEVADFTSDADARYIAAADPQTVLQLVAEVRALRQAVSETGAALLEQMDG